jgi:predicted permease
MHSVVADVRLTCRSLLRQPGFTMLAILSLALGIGTSTAMLAAVNDVLLRPLPYVSPDRLIAIQEQVPRFASISPELPVNAYDFQQWRMRSRTLDGAALVSAGSVVLSTPSAAPQRLSVQSVSASFFSLLGIQPALGRVFIRGDDEPGHEHVAILSHGLWVGAFGSDPAIVGRTLKLSGRSYEVIGVLPQGVSVPRPSHLTAMMSGDVPADIWFPFVVRDPDLVRMSDFNYACIGRLKPAVTLEQARDDLETIERDIARSVSADAELHIVVRPLQLQAAAHAQTSMLVLLVACGIVLLIVCVNVSNLLLSRAIGRRREFSIRAAIGASRARLVQQALTETVTIATAASVIGLMFAEWALRAILAAGTLNLPQLRAIRMDLPAWGVAAGLTLLVSIGTGAFPAWHSATSDPQEALASAGRALSGDGRGRFRRMLIGAEAALCTVALVITGLLLTSFVRLTHVDAGFAADRVLATSVTVPGQPGTGVAFVRALLARVEALSGVTAAGVVNRLPLSGEGSNLGIRADDAELRPNEWPTTDYRCVTPGYFSAIGIPLVSGRLIQESDGDHFVAVVSASTARRLWPGINPVGRSFKLGADSEPAIQVVGIVGDVHGVSLQKAPNLTVYVPYWQRFRPSVGLVVRASGDSRAVVSALQAAVHAMRPDDPLPRVITGEEILDASVAARRFQLDVVIFFGMAALFLAAVGVYGVVSQSVARRRQEIGIRIALGAGRADVWRLVVLEGLAPVVAGLGAGLAASIPAGGLAGALLFAVSPSDPLTLALVTLALLCAAFLACSVPAVRAARVDPLSALRAE